MLTPIRILEKVTEFSQQGHAQQTLPLTIFDATEVGQAFRHMQKGIHIGKILVKMPEDPGTLPAASEEVEVSFRPDAYYLLVGGMGGIGRSVASWMVLNGARNLVFLSRTAGETGSDRAFIKELEDQGCLATPVAGDVANPEDVERAVSLGAVAGVINMAVVLRVSCICFCHYGFLTWVNRINYCPKCSMRIGLQCWRPKSLELGISIARS